MAVTLRGTPVLNFITVPQGWDEGWRKAVAANQTTPCWLGFWGDSVAQGAYAATDWLEGGFPGLVIAALKNRYGTAYAEYWPLADSAWATAGAMYGTIPWVVNDTTHAADIFSAPGGHAMARWAGDSHPSATLATCTPPDAFIDADLIYMQHYVGAGQTFTYTVDGGAPNTVTTVAGSNQLRKAAIPTVASSSHTLVLTGQSIDNTFELAGLATYNAGRGGVGVGYARFCMQGTSAQGVIQTGALPPNINYQQFGGLLATAVTPSPFGFPSAPALLIIEMGLNDCQTGNVASLIMGLRGVIEACRAGTPNASIIVVGASNPDPVQADAPSLLLNAGLWPWYLTALENVAKEYTCAFVNIHAAWGTTPLAAGYTTTIHSPHPTQAGHQFIANALLSIL